jgi:hypothetical protein
LEQKIIEAFGRLDNSIKDLPRDQKHHRRKLPGNSGRRYGRRI